MKNYIINFHGIGKVTRQLESGEHSVWVSEEKFVSIIETIGRLPEVLITFDDGNVSDYTIAFSHLKRLGLKAHFFIIVERIDQPGFLSSQQIKELYDYGMTIGSHGMAHVSWKKMTAETADYEIRSSLKRLQSIIQSDIDSVACPFGTYDKSTLTFLKNNGVRKVYTSDGGYSNDKDWLIARNSIHADDTYEKIKQKMLLGSWSTHQLMIDVKKIIKRFR